MYKIKGILNDVGGSSCQVSDRLFESIEKAKAMAKEIYDSQKPDLLDVVVYELTDQGSRLAWCLTNL